MKGSSGYRLFWIALVTLLVAACSTAPPRELSRSAPNGVYLLGGGVPFRPEGRDPYSDQGGLLAVLERKHSRPLQILELSGGGQYGAFGAGFLNGWSERGGRPKFDIVTGISTGALISTFAFLGTPQDDATLAEIFTNVDQADIYRRRFADVLTGASSFYDTQPLEMLIAKYITPEVLKRVAVAHDRGRRLFVAATNLDYGDLWIFDLGQIAKRGGPEDLELYRKALRASASPPIVFPPVAISGSLLGDGGVKQNLLAAGLLGPGSSVGETTGNVFVIQNGRSTNEPNAVRHDVIDVGERTINLVLTSSMDMMLFRAFAATRIHGYRFNLVSIPEKVPLSGDALAFDRAEMRRVFEVGKRLGREKSPWRQTPPAEGIGPWAVEYVSELDRR